MMSPDKRRILQEKKEQLRIQIVFDEFVNRSILPFLEVLEALQDLGIGFQVVMLRCVPKEFLGLLSEYFKVGPFLKYNLSQIEISTDDRCIEQLLETYPNTHPLRYVPDLPVVGLIGDSPAVVFPEIMSINQIETHKVYLCHLKYAFLLEVNLQDLAQNADWTIFNIWEGDAVIFPKDFSWIIAYSLEEEWRFGVNLKVC